MNQDGERDIMVEVITQRVLEELERAVVSGKLAIEILREIDGEAQE